MDVYFASVAKRPNSTLQPTMTANKRSCSLKHPCSVISPVIELDRTGTDDSFNYAYISDFGRYYFVRDIVYQNAKVVYYLDCDVLASAKSEIGPSYEYVLRAASDSNGDIKDNLYPITGEITTQIDTVTSPWLSYVESGGALQGSFCVGIIGSGSPGVTYYMMKASAFQILINTILSDDYADEVVGTFMTTINPSLKMAIDPLQYIASAIWYPFDYTGSTSVTDLNVGIVSNVFAALGYPGFTTGDCYKVTDTDGLEEPLALSNISFSVRSHPQDARGAYLNSSPFTNLFVNIPPFGTFDLDPMQVHNFNIILPKIIVDLPTGNAELFLYGIYTGLDPGDTRSTLFFRTSGQIGVNMPLTQVITQGFSPMGLIAPILSAAAGDTIGTITGAAGALGSIGESRVPHTRQNGSRGDLSGLYGDFLAVWTWYTVADEDNAHRGRPLCEVRQLNTMSGYLLIADADVHTSLTAAEDEKIKNFMESGFYYE